MNARAEKDSKIMARLRLLALLTAGVTAGACSPHHNVAPPNLGFTSLNQPVVQRTDYVLDLNAGGSGVAPAELGRLDAWFHSLRLGYGDRISLDAPYVDANSRRDVAAVAASYGLLLSDGAPITAGMVAPGSVRVIVSRMMASVPGCPNWNDVPFNASTATSSNYGCATNSNLAAMVADPSDLVLGQSGPGVGDPAAVAKAIRTFRDTGAKPLQAESTGGQ